MSPLPPISRSIDTNRFQQMRMASGLHVKGYFSDEIVTVSELLVSVDLASFAVGGSEDFVPAVVISEYFSTQLEVYTSLLTLQQCYY